MNKKVITALIIMLTGTFLCAGCFWYLSGHNSINRGYIRLHIIANSNSLLDQALKYMVRDEVVRIMTPYLSEVKSIEQARNIVALHQSDIEEAAGRIIAGEGYAYSVKVCKGHFQFPDRTYHDKKGGELTLPAGKYEAVRVIIGQGRGANWWCVLFPPLCFVSPASLAGNTADVPGKDSGAEKYPCSGSNDTGGNGSSSNDFSSIDTPGTGSVAADRDAGDLPAVSTECYIPPDRGLSAKIPAEVPEEVQRVKFRFKLAEWFQDSRHWFDKTFR